MGESSTPFSVEVTSEAWRADAEAWIGDALTARGRSVARTEQPRVRPWSTQLVVDAEGPAGPERFWFKANCRAQAFEPALQSLLAELAPDDVDVPVAADPARGWMLTADRGPTMADRHRPREGDWTRVIGEWAGLQRRLAGRSAEVLAAGVPDCSPATVPARFAELLEVVLGLPAEHPASPDPATADALAAAAGRVERAAATLASSPMPPALQHGDLHPGNVFATGADDSLRIFDFGDAQWAHPIEAVLVPIAVMEHNGLDPASSMAAFRTAWSPIAPDDDDAAWAALVAAAETTHAVNRACTWWGCLAQATDDEMADWGEAVLRHLSRVLGSGNDS